MENTTQTPTSNVPQATVAGYEAPCIETVLTPEELEREVFYAGVVGPTPSFVAA